MSDYSSNSQTDAEYMVDRMKKELLGRTITEIVISDDKVSFGFRVDSDLLCWVDCDPEGNGPGWLAME